MNLWSRLVLVLLATPFTGCTTIVGPDGRPRSVMSREGMALLETAVAAGIGAGTGALMENSDGWASGSVSGAAADVAGQVLRNVIPTEQSVYRAQPQQVPFNAYPQLAQMVGVTQPVVSATQQLYTRRPDGTFVRIQ